MVVSASSYENHSLGAGAWGTAMAISVARTRPATVTLWARDGAQAQAMRAARATRATCPAFRLPRELHVRGGDSGRAAQAVPRADLAIVATPMAGLRGMLRRLRGWAPGGLAVQGL
jgi:glycerol-3-phosphate dehydrogenase (NAD(P)+)